MIVAESPVSPRFAPFAHSVALSMFTAAFAENILQWFERDAPWQLRVESFYEQYELNLQKANPPAALQALIADETIEKLSCCMLGPLTQDPLILTEANAHKLLPGQKIKIHNDYIDGMETHRVLVQLNRNWIDENGGMLMLFSGPNPGDVARVIRPMHGSATGFEISPTSFHAVSTIHAGERYTLVYSFKRTV
jgi:Rps23 Pro-64 3,4-dihydroxylase Tpa1-like proline 4-hydroxylase